MGQTSALETSHIHARIQSTGRVSDLLPEGGRRFGSAAALLDFLNQLHPWHDAWRDPSPRHEAATAVSIVVLITVILTVINKDDTNNRNNISSCYNIQSK